MNDFDLDIITSLYNWAFKAKSGASQRQEHSNPKNYAEDEILVKLRPETVSGEEHLKNEHGIIAAERLFKYSEQKPELSRIFRFKLPPGGNLQQTISRLNADPRVEYAQPNYKRYPCDVVPNDVLYSQQWALTRIQAPQAWDMEIGDPNIVIAVIDSGVDYNHPELAAKIWVNPGEIQGNGIDDDGNGFPDDIRGWSFKNYGAGDSEVMDTGYHGTAVAGIIGAATNNGAGIAGINWNSRIMPVKIDFFDSSAAQAIRYAADNGAGIINMSWGWYADSPVLKDALDYAYAKGCILIAAAGNDGYGVPFIPAAFKNVISVSATDETDGRAGWNSDQSSNFGGWITISAPGKNLSSTFFGSIYDIFEGTSGSAPHISGAASLIVSAFPDYTNEEVKQLLIRSADDLGESGKDNYFGYGRVNLFSALSLPTSGYTPSSANIISPAIGQSFQGGAAIEIYGSAASRDFSRYAIEYGAGDNPDNWQANSVSLVNNGTLPVQNGLLGTFYPANLNSNLLTIRLRTFDRSSSFAEDRTLIYNDDMLKFAVSYQITNNSKIIGADLNRDGKYKIVLNSEQSITLFDESGNSLHDWPAFESGSCYLAAAIGDIDNDGQLEIVAVAQDTMTMSVRLLAWKTNGEPLESWPKEINGVEATDILSDNLVLSDVNNDGKLEMIIAAENGKIFVIDNSGNNLAGWPNQFGDKKPGLAINYINGENWIAIANSNDVRLVDWQGNSAPGWPKTLDFSPSNIIIADLDNDGTSEIIAAGELNPSTKKIAVFDQLGNMKPGWPQTISGSSPSLPVISVGDIDNDGMVEILVNAFDYDPIAMRCVKGTITVFDQFGNQKAGWPKEKLNDCTNNSLIVGSVSANGQNQVLFPAFSQRVDIWNGDGSKLDRWPRFTRGMNYGTALFDLDGNGRKEVIMASFSPDYLKQELYVWEAAESAPGASAWPMVRHDAVNSGNLNYDTEPPRITHTPVTSADQGSPITLQAEIIDDHDVRQAKILYRNTGLDSFQSAEMMGQGGNNWSGDIPAAAVFPDRIEYYIAAFDRAINPAVTGLNSIAITGNGADTTPPKINHDPIAEAPAGMAFLIYAEVTDDLSGVASVKLSYKHTAKYDWKSVDFDDRGGGYYSASIPAEDMLEGELSYYITAQDNKSNQSKTDTYLIRIIQSHRPTGCGCSF